MIIINFIKINDKNKIELIQIKRLIEFKKKILICKLKC